jgi:ribosome recycling factor
MVAKGKKDAEMRMQKSMDALHTELAKLRTGRAHPSLLEQVKVPYHGGESPINQVASVAVADARTLLVTPWEKTLLPVIEKAILTSGLGLNPVSAGTSVRVPLPALNEERRKEMVKIVKAEAENARVAVRNARRDANGELKESLKKKMISEDEERRAQDDIQKLTDKFIAEIDKVLAGKEKELLEI